MATERASSSSSRAASGPRMNSSAVWGRMANLEANFERKFGEMMARIDMFQGTMQRVETKVDRLSSTVGDEKEDGHGQVIATGLVGRQHRTEQKVKDMIITYRVWIAFGTGFVVCGGGMLAAFWWLIGDKVSMVLK